MNVDWTPPPPREGLAGEWDKLIGPGATRAEQWLIVMPALIAPLLLLIHILSTDLDWSIVQIIVGAVLALDVTGGIIANATTAAKRWYHRPGQGTRQHLTFIALHGVHLLLVAWFFSGQDWLYFAIYFAYLLLAAWLIMRAPLYLRRSAALLGVSLALLLNAYLLPAVAGMEWFIPFLFLKLLLSHLLPEAPYTPDARAPLD